MRRVGNSLGVILPKEVLVRLNVTEGDLLMVTEAADGGLRVGSSNPEFAKTMATFESLNRRYKNTLRELAK